MLRSITGANQLQAVLELANLMLSFKLAERERVRERDHVERKKEREGVERGGREGGWEK